jgi:hypothetical protein
MREPTTSIWIAESRLVWTPPAALRRARAPISVSMCWKIAVPSTVKCGSDLLSAKALNAP